MPRQARMLPAASLEAIEALHELQHSSAAPRSRLHASGTRRSGSPLGNEVEVTVSLHGREHMPSLPGSPSAAVRGSADAPLPIP